MTAPDIVAGAPTVSIAQGELEGLWRGRSAAFLGIPFAEPPVGARRFAAPSPAGGWAGRRPAISHGPTPQRRAFAEVTMIPEPSIPGEATLNVDVYTPEPGPGALLPVLVWIHGGGFRAGSPASPWYDGAAFNRDGVVVVNLSYRLGFDGFGWIEDAPANRGLLDMIEGLHWVRRNIAAFGGDPDRVTLAGQSAGGGAVAALLVSPRARGLFHAAITHSAVLPGIDPEQAEQAGRRLAHLAGVRPTRGGLATLSEDRILDLQSLVAESTAHAGTPDGLDEVIRGILRPGSRRLIFSPVVDGEVLPEEPVPALAAGAGREVPLVAGAVAHEFTPTGASFAPMLRDGALHTALWRGGLGPFTDDYLAAYRSNGDSLVIGQLISDVTIRVHPVAYARARGAAPTWLFDFRYPPDGGLTMHCADLPFAWDHLDAEQVTESCGEDPPPELASIMHSAWVDFCRTAEMPWPAWDPALRTVMVFDRESSPGPGYLLEEALLDLLEADSRRRMTAHHLLGR